MSVDPPVPDEKRDANKFGHFTPVQESFVSTKRLFAVFFLGTALVVGTGIAAYVAQKSAETDPPRIDISDSLSALTAKPVAVKIVVKDGGGGSGLTLAKGYIRQAEKAFPVFEEKLANVPAFSKTVDLDAKQLGLSEGPAEFVVEALDNSEKGLRNSKSRSFVVDNQSPALSVISQSASVLEGGTGVVVYRTSDKNLLKSGVAVSDTLFFPGVPAALVDQRFVQPDLFVAYYTTGADSRSGGVLVSEDVWGNSTKSPLKATVIPRPAAKTSQVAFGTAAVDGRLRNLFSNVLASHLSGLNETKGRELLERASAGQRDAYLEMVRVLSEQVWNYELTRIRELLKEHSNSLQQWSGPIRVVPTSARMVFGDTQVVADQLGELFSRQFLCESGEVMATEDVVLAPYRGTVRLAQDLGAHGKTIVIDHGAGIASMFTGLGATQVDWGAIVDQGQRLGTAGESGLEFGRAVRLCILVHGQFVDPGEWRDRKRYLDQIEGPVNGARQQFGIPLIRTGERL